MTESRTEVTIERPLDAVWAVLTDPEKSVIWSEPTIEEQWLTAPPIGVGSRRRAVNKAFGRTTANVAEVTAYEPYRGWTMTSITGPRFVASAAFEPVDNGTHVAFTWTFALSGAQRLFEPILMRVFMAQFRKDLARLKALMENGDL